jgi:hypothetical protein
MIHTSWHLLVVRGKASKCLQDFPSISIENMNFIYNIKWTCVKWHNFCTYIRVMLFNYYLQQYIIYIITVSFINGGSWLVEISLHADTLFWFRAIYFLLLLLKAVCFSVEAACFWILSVFTGTVFDVLYFLIIF